ncbi:MAG: HDOD domain-containing protein [Clostridiales bacterium]|nr:HDOD domain-containing protein [Clostridiales bacterium]
MDAYIARQPIMNREEKVVAYEVLYHQDSSTLYNQRDFRVANAIAQFFTQIDNSNFLEGKDAFLTFTPNLLMQNIPRIFVEDKLIIQIEDNVLVHPVAQMIIQRYKKQGYRLALVDFEFNNRYFNILNSINILKVDFSDPESDSINTSISIAKRFNKEVAAYNVNSPEAKQKAIELGCDYYQGDSIANMVSSKVKRMDYLESNFFRLMVGITRDDPDMEEIAHIIELDVTLTYSLLKMVNSAYFALADRVKDVQHALTILGLGQLKQWVYLLSFNSDSGGMSDELIKVSFQRANFCMELGSLVKGFPLSRSESYLMGMFSTLGTLLDVDLEDALNQLPVSEEMKTGLINNAGMTGDLYNLVVCYEKGEWNKMNRFAERLEIPVSLIAQKYFEVIEYVNEMWNELMRPFVNEEEEEAFTMPGGSSLNMSIVNKMEHMGDE